MHTLSDFRTDDISREQFACGLTYLFAHSSPWRRLCEHLLKGRQQMDLLID